uniref:protein SPIRAL1-like 3 n=1 Tax=Erigeron canadensis TaxID=72917 RepID=UPI001CB9203D|nr:protein SPIRAL1-like 3 [Erigeron canadensis]
MGRGVSCGGGQSSLGYLFGGSNTGGEATDGNAQPPPQNPTDEAATNEPSLETPVDNDPNTGTNDESLQKPTSESYNLISHNANAPVHDSTTNNYHRADGQNCGNFITDRPSTKVHAAPGGNSSLGYLFGDDKK